MRKLREDHKVYYVDPAPLREVLYELIQATHDERNEDAIEAITLEQWSDSETEQILWTAKIVTYGDLR